MDLRRRTTTGVVGALIVTTCMVSAMLTAEGADAQSARGSIAASAPDSAGSDTDADRTLALPTGERVRVRTLDGHQVATFADRDVSVRVIRFGEHTWVIPDSAMPGLLAGRLDASSFDIGEVGAGAGVAQDTTTSDAPTHTLTLHTFSKPGTPARRTRS